jgi:hypothetical protein
VGIERVGWGGWVGMGRRGGEEEGVGWGAEVGEWGRALCQKRRRK